jgi:hypothetical protein
MTPVLNLFAFHEILPIWKGYGHTIANSTTSKPPSTLVQALPCSFIGLPPANTW